MATLHMSAFTRSYTLSRVHPPLLRCFLERFSGFFESRGLNLNDDIDPDQLSGILMSPEPDTPRELIDALFCIKEMSVPSASDALLDEAQRLDILTDPNTTQPEIALRVWMADPEALPRRHAELAMTRVRSFEYFSSIEEDEVELPTHHTLQSLERALDIFFEERGHGTGTRIHVYPRGHEMWFLIRHGDLFRREATLVNGQSSSVAYRPEKYDLVVFNQLTNELGINAKTEKIRNEYRKQFAFYLFGRDNQFAGTSKYSLEPIREVDPNLGQGPAQGGQ